MTGGATPDPAPRSAWSASWNLAPGDELGPGRTVIGRLGESLRHEVVLVWDAGLGELGAAKVARPRTGTRGIDVKKLRREADVLERIDHPVFPRCLDRAFEAERPHLVVQYAPGPSLRELVRRQGHMPPAQALPLFAPIAGGLAHLADRGIVHADLTADNLIAGVRPFVIDLDRAFDAAAPGNRLKYKPASTRAPELCRPQAGLPAGPAADVFSLGAIMFAALAGHRPFPRPGRREDGTREPPAQLGRAPAPILRPLPRGLRRLLAAMLAQDPAQRPSAAEVAVRLEALHADGRRRDRRIAGLGARLSRARRREPGG